MAELTAEDLKEWRRRRALLAGGGAAPAVQGTSALENIEGFAGRTPRTDDLAKNALADFSDLWDGYKAIGGLLMEQGPGALLDVAKKLPGAIATSYKRWYDAARQGVFLEAVRAHPVEYLNDVAAPLSIALGGAGGLVKIFGTGTKAAKVSRILAKGAAAMDAVQLATDPIGGTAFVTTRRVLGMAIKGSLKSPPVPAPMGLGFDDAKLNLVPVEAPRGIVNRLDDLVAGAKVKVQQMGKEVFDANMPLRKLSQKAAGGSEVAPLELRVRTYAGLGEKVNAVMDRGWIDPNDVTKPLKPYQTIAPEPVPFRKVIEDLGSAQLDDLNRYAAARRAVYDLGPRKIETGIDAAEAGKVLQEFEPRLNPRANPDIHEAWLRMRQWSDDRLTYYTKAGMIDQKTADAFRKQNPNYVPFYRETTPMGQGGGGAGGLRPARQFIKGIKGSESRISNTVESEYLATARTIREVELNQIMRELDSLADVEGSGVRRIEGPEGIGKAATPDDLQLTMDLEGLGDDLAAGRSAVQTVNSPLSRPKGLPENVVPVYRDGQRTFLQIDDPDVAQSMALLRFRPESPIPQIVMKPLRGFAALQRAGVTMNPRFILIFNMVRDAWQATTIGSKYGFVPVFDQIRGLMEFGKRGEVFDLWAKSGGMQAHMTALDRPALRKNLMEYMKGQPPSYFRQFKTMNPLRWLQLLREGSEAATRMGEFRKGLHAEFKPEGGEGITAAIRRAQEAGMDTDSALRRAAVASRDASTDFALQGASPLIRAYNSMTAFQNANLQSLDLLRRRLLTGTPKQRALAHAKAALGITVPSLVTMLRNRHDKEYQDIPDVEKDLFLHARLYADPAKQVEYMNPANWGKPPPEGGELIRIPLPFEVGLIYGALPRRAFESMAGVDPNFAERMLPAILDQFWPFAVPTLVKPFAEVEMDRSMFFGGSLEPETSKRLTKGERTLPNTSEVGKLLSGWTQWLEDVPLGTKISGEKRGPLSPIEVDHILFSLGGTLPREVVKAFDPAIRKLRGLPEAPAQKGGALAKIPVIGGITANPSQRSQVRTDFFKTFTLLQQRKSAVTSISFEGDRKDYLGQHKRDIAHADVFAKAASEIFELTKAQRAIAAAKNLDAKTKRRQMDRLDKGINEIARRVMAWRRDQLERR